MKIIKYSIGILILIMVIAFIFGSTFYFAITCSTILDINKISLNKRNLTVLDASDNPIRNNMDNHFVTLREISPNLINAIIATEDKRFYYHDGLDYKRIIGAIIHNIKEGSRSQGGSTITQQLIKNTHLSHEKTFSRKLKEMKLARELEKNLSKEEILEAYLNVIYFGNGIYGVQNASNRFFGKNCDLLSIAESASIAAVIKNPSKFTPLKDLEVNTQRRNLVLKLMYEQKMITSHEYNEAISQVLTICPSKINDNGSYIDSVIYQASKILGIDEKNISSTGYVIKTYFDQETQDMIINSINVDKNYNKYVVLCDNHTGGIIAYYNDSYYNAYNLRRQPGSIIKPFISYLPALSMNIIAPCSPILDEKQDFNGYLPSNYNDKYYGWIDCRTAVSKSLNIPAVKLVNDIGIYSAIKYAEKFGLKFVEEDYTLASALGGLTNGSNCIEICSAYSCIANNGYYREISFIREILDEYGNVIYSGNKGKHVESPETTYLMIDMLMECTINGTANKLYNSKFQIASKTGTVKHSIDKGNNDAWNISFTSSHTLCTWVGNLDNSVENSLPKEITGSNLPTKISSLIYNRLYKTTMPQDFIVPNNIKKEYVSRKSLEKDHEIVLSSEFDSINDSILEIFDPSFEIKSKDSKGILSLVVNGLDYKISDDVLIISFIGNKDVKYNVIRNTLFDSITVESVDGNGEKIEIKIQNDDQNASEYYIIPYFINYLGDVVYGIESERILIDTT